MAGIAVHGTQPQVIIDDEVQGVRLLRQLPVDVLGEPVDVVAHTRWSNCAPSRWKASSTPVPLSALVSSSGQSSVRRASMRTSWGSRARFADQCNPSLSP